VKELQLVYPGISRQTLYNIKKNHKKYSLNENDFYETKDGKLIRFGRGSFYKVEDRLNQFMVEMRELRK